MKSIIKLRDWTLGDYTEPAPVDVEDGPLVIGADGPPIEVGQDAARQDMLADINASVA